MIIADKLKHYSECVIYGARWVIAPMYLGLFVALIAYTYKFLIALYELVIKITIISDANLLLSVLSLIDTVMIGNLILIITIGSYTIFVRKLECIGEHDKPQWLNSIDSGSLKVKMGMSLIGVSSIHLLKDFIEAEVANREVIYKHVAIHIVFILSTLALAVTNKLTHSNVTAHETAIKHEIV